MKKILIMLILVTGLIACENRDIEFEDFIFTSGYFPYQYPVRTLVLGDYIYPNENDNNHKFLISAAMGGVYSNKQERIVNIQPAPELCNNVLFSANGDTIRLMPQAYYSLSSSSQIIIPAGKVNAGIEVQLNDAFFDDTLAFRLGYVIPLRIVSSVNLDTVLQGKTSKMNPDLRVPGDWEIAPKNFTMFAVKYINPFHGSYLHRGVSVVKDATSATLETTPYRARYAEQNEIWKLVTSGKNKVGVSGVMRSAIITGTLMMELTFADNGTCTIAQSKGSAHTITGSGKFVEDAESWGGTKHDAIFMTYQLTSGGNTYSATDTLAIRDRGVVMEVYNPVVFTP
jgi:hypothetical protein